MSFNIIRSFCQGDNALAVFAPIAVSRDIIAYRISHRVILRKGLRSTLAMRRIANVRILLRHERERVLRGAKRVSRGATANGTNT